MSILVATPCFNGLSTGPFESSCYNLKKELASAGVSHDFLRISNESLITRARNVIAASFLRDTEYECLLFIDADIEFDPADVARLWNLCASGDADVAVGCYRHKNPDAKLEAWVGGKLRPLSDFKEPFAVDYAGTGFMMIRRKVLERLRASHPDWEYDEGFPTEQRGNIPIQTAWAFFQDPIWNRTHLSEDYFFCKAARAIGFKVIMDPEIKLKHWGAFAF